MSGLRKDLRPLPVSCLMDKRLPEVLKCVPSATLAVRRQGFHLPAARLHFLCLLPVFLLRLEFYEIH